MKRFLYKILWLPFYRVWALRHIQKNQNCKIEGIQLTIPVGVFHPGIFFSTTLFIQFLKIENFEGKKTLDIGTGSGILALFTAKNGAIATAIDLNPRAVETAKQNAITNQLSIQVLQSDLLDEVQKTEFFDYILINPPYYPKKATNNQELAFFAGENLEYFEKLFTQLPAFCHPHTKVWMVLSEDCDFQKLKSIAAKNYLNISEIADQKKWGEVLFIAEVRR